MKERGPALYTDRTFQVFLYMEYGDSGARDLKEWPGSSFPHSPRSQLRKWIRLIRCLEHKSHRQDPFCQQPLLVSLGLFMVFSVHRWSSSCFIGLMYGCRRLIHGGGGGRRISVWMITYVLTLSSSLCRLLELPSLQLLQARRRSCR